MSYAKTGNIKSIYGIIADAIKEEIKILLKSDYFAYQGCLIFKNKTHTRDGKKGNSKSTSVPLFFCSKQYNSIGHMLGWKVKGVFGQCQKPQFCPKKDCQCIFLIYV